MHIKLNHYIAFLAASAFVVANTFLGYAEDINIRTFSAKTEVRDGAEDISEMDFEEVSSAQNDEDSEPSATEIQQKQQDFLQRIREELNLSKTAYKQLLNSISDTKTRLENVSDEKNSLSMQIQNLDDMINLTSEKLLNVVKQVVETENEISVIYQQIEVKKVAMKYQKELLKDYIDLMYREENAYLSYSENGGVNAFKLLLSDDSVGKNLRELEYFSLLNAAGRQMADKLTQLSFELSQYRSDLEQKKSRLTDLQGQLEAEKKQLEFQKASKDNLMNITLGQEDIYSQLLEQTVKEQEQVLQDIKNFSNAVGFIENKIAEEGDNFDPDDYLSLLDYKTQVLYDFKLNYQGSVDGFAWPVDDYRGINAYFHDPSYFGVFGVQHNAIDLALYQGSPVRAAADGVVYTARDNGYGYSYIILAHADGFLTVYGHISEILVEEGDMISQGAVIGLSGGMPGTKGAGYMTTGPHLHFEMMLNGLYVDPLDYMPLETLSKEDAEALPEKYYDDWEEAVYDKSIAR